MTSLIKLCTAGVVAGLTLAAGPASAQYYGDEGPYGPHPYYDSTYGWPGYTGYGPAYGGYGPGYGVYGGRGYGYRPRREAFVAPNGYVYRRCRPHRACYNGPDY